MMIDQPIDSHLHGCVALVTDGGRGLGAAITLALAEAGAALAPMTHESCEVTAVAALVRRSGQPILGVTTPDYGDAESVAVAIDTVREYLGPITILVDTVGIPTVFDAVLPDMTDAGWGIFVTVTADAPFLVADIACLHIDSAAPTAATATQVRDFCVAARASAQVSRRGKAD